MSDNQQDSFMKECIERAKNFTLDKKFLEREYVARYRFKTKNSGDIKYSLMVMAEENIDRDRARNMIKQYVGFDHIAYEIERGLFEFALINVTINKSVQDHFVIPIYHDKLYNICENLDLENENIDNKTLLPTIFGETFTPYYVAFLSPDQLHPKRWMDIVLKKQIRDEAMNNFQTTDIYKCKKCKERKFKITEIQLRSSDEPMNRVCTCMTCYYTFIL
jgi:DNA-directed RNA polymerase subunit M/transcription elongation factor TFIIS